MAKKKNKAVHMPGDWLYDGYFYLLEAFFNRKHWNKPGKITVVSGDNGYTLTGRCGKSEYRLDIKNGSITLREYSRKKLVLYEKM